MKIYLNDDGSIEFLDGATINRNTLNRKKLEVTLETALTAYESLWVQFGDSENYDDETANILEPIRLKKVSGEANQYFKLVPDEVVTAAGTWYMTLAIRKYSAENSETYTANLTSEQVSFTVNDNFPVKDKGYVSNATMETFYNELSDQIPQAITAKDSAEAAAKEAEASAQKAQAAMNTASNTLTKAEAAATKAEAAATKAANAYEIDATTTAIDYTLTAYVDKTFSADGITSVKLTVPATAEHGFIAGVNIKTGSTKPTFKIINNTSNFVKYVLNGSTVDAVTAFAANMDVKMTVEHDGAYIVVVIAEV